MALGDMEMAQAFLNTETEGLEKGIWRPPCPDSLIHQQEANPPSQRQHERAPAPSCPIAGLSSRNSEPRASTRASLLGPHTSLRLPIRVSPGLR